MRFLILILLSFWLTACGKPQPLTPAPTPVSVFISYPAYLQPELNKLTDCAGQIASISIFTIPGLPAESDLPGPLLKLQPGSVSLDGSLAYQIGQLEIEIIVNAANPLDSLSTEELRAIYTGQQNYWEHNPNVPIHVWSYPGGDDLRSMLETALTGAPRLTLTAQIAPHPQAILEAVSADANGIGYLPASWMDNLSPSESNQIKAISLDPALHEDLTQPVIVTISEALTYPTEALLVCVQQTAK